MVVFYVCVPNAFGSRMLIRPFFRPVTLYIPQARICGRGRGDLADLDT